MSRNDDRSRLDPEGLDDATVEELLTGRYTGGTPDLAELARVFETMSAVKQEAPPPASPALQAILSPELPVAPTEPRDAPSRRRRPRRVPRVALGIGVAALAMTTAGAVGALPAPVQRLVASAVRTVTPFEIPDPAGEAVASHPPTSVATTIAPSAPVGETGPGGGGVNGETAPRAAPPSTARSLPAPAGVPTSTSLPASRPGAAPAEPGNKENAGPQPSPPAGRPDLTASMTGRTVVPRTGDPDGTATALLALDIGRSQLCLQLSVAAIAAPTAVHIHAGREGEVGRIIAAVAPPPGPGATTCVPVARQELTDVRAHPERYYVEVHNGEFPDGAVRGQLQRP